MKDIRASGQRVMAIIDDLLDLSRIETGKMELFSRARTSTAWSSNASR